MFFICKWLNKVILKTECNIFKQGGMNMNINFSYEEQSIHNLAFIKALFIKHKIESLNISHNQKEALLKDIEGVLNEKEN